MAIVLRQALKRKWRNLAQERIEDVKPTIPLGKCFWALSDKEKKETGRICQTEEVRKMVTSLGARNSNDELTVLDAAYWMKGCSSLGRLRYAVLVQAGKGKHGKNSLCLLDIKEAGKPAAPRQTDAPMSRDNARRIVAGACALSPFLGERMVASHFLDRQVVIRELLPQDLKIELDSITKEDAVTAARFLAEVNFGTKSVTRFVFAQNWTKFNLRSSGRLAVASHVQIYSGALASSIGSDASMKQIELN